MPSAIQAKMPCREREGGLALEVRTHAPGRLPEDSDHLFPIRRSAGRDERAGESRSVLEQVVEEHHSQHQTGREAGRGTENRSDPRSDPVTDDRPGVVDAFPERLDVPADFGLCEIILDLGLRLGESVGDLVGLLSDPVHDDGARADDHNRHHDDHDDRADRAGDATAGEPAHRRLQDHGEERREHERDDELAQHSECEHQDRDRPRDAEEAPAVARQAREPDRKLAMVVPGARVHVGSFRLWADRTDSGGPEGIRPGDRTPPPTG